MATEDLSNVAVAAISLIGTIAGTGSSMIMANRLISYRLTKLEELVRERAAKARECEARARDLNLSAVDRFFEQDDVEFWADTNRTLEAVRAALRDAQLVGA